MWNSIQYFQKRKTLLQVEKRYMYNFDYISLHFSNIHDISKIKRDYKRYLYFFKYNYLNEIPKEKDIKILDMGCGLGENLYALEVCGYKNLYGVDYSKECVDFCEKLLPNTKFFQGDALTFFENRKKEYDVIFFNDIIEHFVLEDVVKILNDMKNSLKENGVIIIKTMNGGNIILGGVTLYSDLTHKIMFDEFTLKEVAKLAGFTNIRVKKSNLYCFMLNPFNYIAWGINGFISLLLRLYFILNNKKNKIFTKNIIAIIKND